MCFDLAIAFSEVIALIGSQFLADNIEITMTCIGENEKILECYGIDDFAVYGYPNEFKQVVINFKKNSEHAILSKRSTQPEGWAGKIDVLLSLKNKHIEAAVCDNGGGVSKNILHKIFDPYYTTEDGNSAGVGLFMAKAIVEPSMGGSVRAENYQEGFKTNITLPRGSIKQNV